MRSKPLQLSLFGDDVLGPKATKENRQELDYRDDEQLAQRLPSDLFFGASSWNYPGWSGLVYPENTPASEIADRGLQTYCKHPLLRTVGIARAYYNPLTDDDWRRYRTMLPAGYRCVLKTWNTITSTVIPSSNEPNPHFLDAGLFCDRVLAPVARSFYDHIGPIVLELPPMPTRLRPNATQFVDRLHRFLDELPREFNYAVELRNKELLSSEYLRLLKHHRVAHILNVWHKMPSIFEQMQYTNVFTAPFVVCRLMLRPGTQYKEIDEKYSPFDKIHFVDEKMRNDFVKLANYCTHTARPLYVIVSNKVEGCAPLTIRALAQALDSHAA